MAQRFPAKIIEDLASYVYMYSDPKTKKPFYIGKGTGNRVFSHLNFNDETKVENEKFQKIAEIRKRGKEPLIEILAYGLNDEAALIVEAAAIDLLGVKNLTNQQSGHGSKKFGRIEINKLIAKYGGELEEGDVTEKVLCIVPNQLYRTDMNAAELYDATRGYWPVAYDRAKQADYVFSVYKGRVLEVYKVIDWYPAGTTFMATRENDGIISDEKYEFVGQIATKAIRKKYVNKSLYNIFPPHTWENSFRYINIPER